MERRDRSDLYLHFFLSLKNVKYVSVWKRAHCASPPLFPPFLSLTAASSRTPLLASTWPTWRRKKKNICVTVSAASLCLFFDFWLWVRRLRWATGQTGCVHHNVYCVRNGWMGAQYLKVLVVRSFPAVPLPPYRPSHLGHLNKEINDVTWLLLSPFEVV